MSETEQGHPMWEHLNRRCGSSCLYCKVAKLEAENARLREALETIRDAGLEPIDPAYREHARAALGGDDE